MLEHIKKKFKQKCFQIDLDDEYCFPAEKDFIFPNTFVIQAAIENYCIKNKLQIEYISKEKPISFILDGKTKYSVELVLVRGHFYSGYTIMCKEILEEI